eukprot:tig00000984_g5994.t1
MQATESSLSDAPGPPGLGDGLRGKKRNPDSKEEEHGESAVSSAAPKGLRVTGGSATASPLLGPRSEGLAPDGGPAGWESPADGTSTPGDMDEEGTDEERDGHPPGQRSRRGLSRKSKKPRLQWSPELHQRFVEAVSVLGSSAVPKSILQHMNEPGLSRENIASHLQKYRLSLRRNSPQVTPKQEPMTGLGRTPPQTAQIALLGATTAEAFPMTTMYHAAAFHGLPPPSTHGRSHHDTLLRYQQAFASDPLAGYHRPAGPGDFLALQSQVYRMRPDLMRHAFSNESVAAAVATAAAATMAQGGDAAVSNAAAITSLYGAPVPPGHPQAAAGQAAFRLAIDQLAAQARRGAQLASGNTSAASAASGGAAVEKAAALAGEAPMAVVRAATSVRPVSDGRGSASSASSSEEDANTEDGAGGGSGEGSGASGAERGRGGTGGSGSGSRSSSSGSSGEQGGSDRSAASSAVPIFVRNLQQGGHGHGQHGKPGAGERPRASGGSGGRGAAEVPELRLPRASLPGGGGGRSLPSRADSVSTASSSMTSGLGFPDLTLSSPALSSTYGSPATGPAHTGPSSSSTGPGSFLLGPARGSVFPYTPYSFDSGSSSPVPGSHSAAFDYMSESGAGASAPAAGSGESLPALGLSAGLLQEYANAMAAQSAAFSAMHGGLAGYPSTVEYAGEGWKGSSALLPSLGQALRPSSSWNELLDVENRSKDAEGGGSSGEATAA